jgi:hypothetical protein
MGGAPAADSGEPLMENRKRRRPVLTENKSKKHLITKSFTERYFDMLAEQSKKTEEIVEEIVDFNGKNATMEDRIRQVCSTIDNLINEEEYENENLINEAVSALSIDNNDVEVDDVDLE